jgi:hypothetical protein
VKRWVEPVDVAAERHAILVDDPQVAERHDLEPAGVGEDRLVPGHEPVQPAEPLDAFVPGRRYRWYVLARMIVAPAAAISSGSRALTVAFVPTA